VKIGCCALQIQADLGEGHVNIINAKEALLTEFHLALVMEYATRGTLTAYVAEHWHHGQQHGLFLTEDEARYLFRVCIFLLGYLLIYTLPPWLCYIFS
jgi:serine/threonine-protein kinase SRK2